jgi:RHS repeat-associated protein
MVLSCRPPVRNNYTAWRARAAAAILVGLTVAAPSQLAALLAAAVSAATVVPSGTAAASVTAVTPYGASAGVSVQITGTGFDPASANNSVTLTPATGAAVTLTAETIATLDASKGLRRLGIRVPAGFPIGPASVRVTNQTTGHSAYGATLQVIAISLPETRSAARGAQNVAVRIAGTSNVQFVAGRTTVMFGAGVTVTGVQVTSPTSLLATVSIGPTTPLGLRNVTVVTSTQTAQLLGAFSITGANPVQTPIANAGSDQTVAVGTVVTLNGSASSHPNGNQLTFQWTLISKPQDSEAVLSDPTAVMPTFVADRRGTYDAQLVVYDGATASGPDIVRISTQNSRPIANAGADQTARVGDTVRLTGSGSTDPDGDPLTFAWSFVSVPPGSAATLANPTSVESSFVIDRFGDYTVQLIVSDGALASLADTVTVSTINSVPVANAGADQTARVGDTATLDGSASSDADRHPLTFRWSFTSRPSGSAATLADPTAVNPRFTIDVAGTFVVQLIVNDGLDDGVADTVSVTTVNSPPVANAGPDQTVFVGDTVHLTGAASTDVDGNTLTFAWSLTTKPAGSTTTLSDATAVNPTFTADVAGEYIAQLIVNDGAVTSAADTVSINTRNQPPVANAGVNQTVALDAMVQLDGSGSSDPNHDPLTFTWSLLSRPEGSAATLSDATASNPTFVADRPGSYVAQLVVHDGTVTSAPHSVTISTLDSAPIANAGPDQNVITGSTVQLDGGGSFDPDGTPLQFAWSLLSKPAESTAALSSPALVNPALVADRPGVYVAQLIVGDGSLLSAPDTVSITVQDGADLRLVFVDPPASPAVGSLAPAGLRVDIFNDGPSPTTGVTVHFPLPAGYTFFNVAHPGGDPYDVATGVWTVGAMGRGTQFTLILNARVNPTGPYDLVATIAGNAQPDPDPSNNTATAAVTPNPDADLRIAFTDPPAGNVAIGQIVSVRVDVSSSGPAATSDVVVHLPVPAGYTFFNVAHPGGNPYDSATGDWTIGSMGSGTQATLILNLRVNATGPMGLTASLTNSRQPDPNLANNTATAAPPNRPPVAEAGADAAGVAHSTVSLDGHLSGDPDGNALTYHWEFEVRPGSSIATLANANTVTPSFVPDLGGRYVVQLVVRDSHGVASAVDAVTVTAAVLNQAPSITSTAPTTGAAGQLYRYDAKAFDPDAGDVLTFSLMTAPAGLAIDAANGAIQWTPSDAQGGPQPVTVRVQDAAGLFDTQSFAVQVSSAANGAPIATDDAAEVRVGESVSVGTPGVLRNDTDPDGSPLTVALATPPANGSVTLSGDGSFIYTPHALRADDFVLLENGNLATRVAGVVVEAAHSGFSTTPAMAADDDLGTSWRGNLSLGPSLEVVFPQDVTVTQLQLFGLRDPFLIANDQGSHVGFFQLFGADGTELLNTGGVDLPLPARDTQVNVPGIAGVRRVRFTTTESGTLDAIGFAELKVIGSALIRRPLTLERNLAQLLPTVARASSVSQPNVPESAIDDLPHASNWYAGSGSAGEFIELIFPVDVTVTELQTIKPVNRPDGFGTSLGMECPGNFELFDSSGAELFDSGVVNNLTGSLQSPQTFTQLVPNVTGVRRVRWTSAGCGPSFPPGFSEFRVFGSASVSPPAFSVAKKFQGLLGREVHSTPIVVNLTDDNHDGRIDAKDIPDIVVPVESLASQITGEIKAISGDDGRELFTAGGPNLVSPWSELAAGDLDGDGVPEIVAVHADGNHLIAFEHTGAVRWTSDAHAMPRFNTADGVGNPVVFVVGAVSIANLDGGVRPHIVVGASIFDADGRLLGDGRTLGGTTGGAGLRSAISAIGDIDLDGVPEIVAGPTAYRLVNGQLTVVWQRTNRPDGYVAIANLDDDPFAEVVIVANGVVYALNHDGTDFQGWNAPTHAPVAIPGGGQGGAPLIADTDGDGKPEIGVAGFTNFVVFNRDGSVRWQSATTDRSSNSTGSVAFDLDGDGSIEIVYRDEVFLRIYRGADGVLLAKIPIESSTWSEIPVIADVDNDGHADIVVSSDRHLTSSVGSTGVHVLQDAANKWIRTRPIWNQHSYHVTNVHENGTIPRLERPHWLAPGLNSFRINAFVPGETTDERDSFTYKASDGTLESNAATVRIAVRPANSAPSFTSTPITIAATSVRYSYVAQAFDPDAGEVFAFSLPTAPDGMTIDPDFGFVEWTPSEAQLGTHPVVIKVQDAHGAFALQHYSIVVSSPVTVPHVIGQARASAKTEITDAGFTTGGVATQTHPVVPAGTVISQNPAGGALAAPGSAVSLVVSLGRAVGDTDNDADGFSPNQGDCDDANLNIRPGATDVPGNGIDEDCTGADAVDPRSVDGDGDGFTPAAGDCNDTNAAINPAAVDVPGNGIDENCNGADAITGDGDFPTAAINSPEDGAVVTMPVNITGTATDANFLRYRLELSEVDATTRTVIGSGSTPVVGGVLGRLDPTLLENGLYRVRLVVEDVNGQIALDDRVYRVDGAAKVGLMAMSFIDLQVPLAGVSIAVIRSYDSRVKTSRDFGVGWTLGINTGKYRNNRPTGHGWTVNDLPFLGGSLPCIGGSTETRSHFTEVRLSDLEFYTFVPTVSSANLGITGACEVTAGFRFLDGSTPGATLDILDGTSAIYLRGGEDVLLDMNAFFDGTNVVYNPRRVRLTTADGRMIEFDRIAGVTRIEDTNSNALTITPAGVVHSSGKSIAFVRDAFGRVTRVTDPKGNALNYAYDARGDLTEFIDQANNRTTFTYDDRHNLLEIHDPLGNRAVRNEYDADGRLVAVVDAAGRRTAIVHDLSARRETTTDRLGNTSIVEYDERGNVVRQVDPLAQVTRFTFDSRDNMLSMTDPLGHTSTYTYDDRDNALTVTDALGNRSAFTYNSRNEVLTRTDPRGGVTTSLYDSRSNLVRETDAAGGSTAHAYDSRGNRIRTTDAVGAVWTYSYDSSGRAIQTTTPLGDIIHNARDANGNILTEARNRLVNGVTQVAVTRFTYDALNRRIRIVNAGGAVHEATYSGTGQVATRTDPCCGQTAFTYDELDQRIRTLYPDGTSESVTYDADGRQVSQTDRAGRTTRFSYDAVGRLLRTTHPDGSEVAAEYDAAGQKTAEVNELGRTTRFTYDAAGRRISTIDPLGGTTLATYDDAGNLASSTDRNGRVTTYSYDGENRHVRTTSPDGTFVSTAYDAEGRKLSQTDQAGNVTRFEYDLRGALTRVVDPLGNATRYTFSEFNKQTTHTNPLGETKRLDYDILGRRTLTSLPLGQTEARTYDVAGRLIALRDYNGGISRYTYDTMNRLTQRTLPDGEVHSFTYTPTGRVASFADGTGTTELLYDLRDRPTVVRRPDGAEIRYAYDAAGNRTGLVTPAGTSTYAYDANNRLTELTDFHGHRSTFQHDAEGNLSGIAYPNGLAARYEYDLLNRLTNLTHSRAGTTLRSFHYTLGPTGNRTRVLEDTGRIVDYTYDALFRLTGETITSPGGDPVSTTYTYDAVGNRVRQSGPGGVVSYTYDGNGRLLRAGPRTFAYDNNGNLVDAINGTGSISYDYDGLNRLIRATSATGVTEYAYDAMGHRVLKTDGGGSTRYLIDPFGAGELSRVLRETNASGSVDYVFAGGMLMSMRRVAGTSFYLHDGSKSTRTLTNAAGSFTDRYDYDAFGNVLSRAGTTPNLYLFDGQELDPNLGFYNLRARYYDSVVGRFTATDPFPGIIVEPASLNPYTYAFNDPVNKSDPSGKFTLIEQITIATTAGVIAGIGYAAHNYYYYRSAELAFEVGVDAFFSVADLAMDMLGAGALVRPALTAVARGIGQAFAGKTLVGQTARNIGKTASTMLEESVERVLCRSNNPTRCGLMVVTVADRAAEQIVQGVYSLSGQALRAARARLGPRPEITVRAAGRVVAEAVEEALAPPNVSRLAKELDDALKKALKEANEPPIR